MQIALTGATGFVGRVVAEQLLAAGHGVRALVRSKRRSTVPAAIETVEGDLADEAALARLVTGVRVVIHVAGSISASRREQFFAVNAAGTGALARAAANVSAERFIHISSLSARAPGLTAYGASKAAGEAALSEAAPSLQRLIIRPPAVYGPGDVATLPLIKALTASPVVLPGNPGSRFSLIHVGDLARIITEAVASVTVGTIEVDDGKAGGYSWEELVAIASQAEQRQLKPYFLPKQLSYSVAAVAEGVAKLRGASAMLTRDKVRELYAEDWVAKGPGWPLDAPTPFRIGFASTVDWYRKAGWLPPRRRAIVPNEVKT